MTTKYIQVDLRDDVLWLMWRSNWGRGLERREPGHGKSAANLQLLNLNEEMVSCDFLSFLKAK